jgi:hypothetical protein
MTPRIAVLFCSLSLISIGAAAAPTTEAPVLDPFTPAEFAAAVRQTTAGFTVRAVVGPARTPLPLAVSNFLLDRPDLAAFIVDRRRIAPYRIAMLGPRRSLADDGEGTVGIINLISKTDHRRVYYGEGEHRSRFLPAILASAVIVMDLSEETRPDGRLRTISTFEVFVRMNSRFVAGVVKTLRPFLQKTVVGKFSKAFFVADAVGQAMARDPASVGGDVRAFAPMFDEDRAALLEMIARLPPPPPSSPAPSPAAPASPR